MKREIIHSYLLGTVGKAGYAVYEKIQSGVLEHAVVLFPRFSTVVYQRGKKTLTVRLRVDRDHGF